MKKLAGLIISLMAVSSSFSQVDTDRINDSLVEEGLHLYKSEMASWYGTDIFREQYKGEKKIGGYFSYSDKEGNKCIFFSKEDTPRILGTIVFDDTYNVQTAKASLEERELTGVERDLCMLRMAASKAINGDTLFKSYQHMNLNLIPLISGDEKKVYVLTGPEETGVVVFGNDYLLTFDGDNAIKSKKQLHRNILTINYGEAAGKGQEVEASMHSHSPETGDFITATDICTLMLYEKYAKWKRHYVVSAHYYCIWNCETDKLFILTKEAMERINEDQEQKHGRSKH
ncbi:MAG TPA: hypothetical protein VHD83_00020 [Puia sp.]|nr:hypothetical protein [Puia sp.]